MDIQTNESRAEYALFAANTTRPSEHGGVTGGMFEQAKARMQAQRAAGHAVSAQL